MPRSSIYNLKTAAGTLRQHEFTRISYLVGIYKALHILLPDDLADGWMNQTNDDFLFTGQTPLAYVIQAGIPGLHRVRSLLDAARSDVKSIRKALHMTQAKFSDAFGFSQPVQARLLYSRFVPPPGNYPLH